MINFAPDSGAFTAFRMWIFLFFNFKSLKNICLIPFCSKLCPKKNDRHQTKQVVVMTLMMMAETEIATP